MPPSKILPRYRIGTVDVCDIRLESEPLIRSAVEAIGHEAAARILTEIADKNISVSFPWEWQSSDGRGNQRPRSPTIIYVELPLYRIDEDAVEWAFDLREAVETLIANNSVSNGTIPDDGTKQALTEIAEGFEGLAQHLRKALGKKSYD